MQYEGANLETKGTLSSNLNQFAGFLDELGYDMMKLDSSQVLPAYNLYMDSLARDRNLKSDSLREHHHTIKKFFEWLVGTEAPKPQSLTTAEAERIDKDFKRVNPLKKKKAPERGMKGPRAEYLSIAETSSYLEAFNTQVNNVIEADPSSKRWLDLEEKYQEAQR